MAAGALAGGEIASSLIPNKSSGSGSSTSSGTSSQYGASSTTSPYGNVLGVLGQGELGGVGNLTSNFENAANNALTRGTLQGSMIPMAQAAISQARGAAGANLGSAENFLAQSGGANSPFAAQLLSSVAAQGNEATAQAPVSIYDTILGQIPGFIQGMTGLGNSALGTAGSLSNSSQNNSSAYSRATNVSTNKSSSGGFGF